MTPLHHIGNFVRETLLLIPLGVVRILFVGILALLLIWVLQLPKSETTQPTGSGRWYDNLKIGASIALLIQIVIYSVL
jgi:hypothetical protein